MASPDYEVSVYDLGVTSIRLIMVANVIQIVFSRKQAAAIFYAATAKKFKEDEEEWRSK
jgi:hypothetical protein